MSNVVVALQGRTVLGPLELALAERSFTLIEGASGSGKTTLLRTIAGLTRVTSGTVRISGALANDGPRFILPAEKRRIGFLFQGGGLWPHMSVRRTIEFVLSCRGTPRSERARRVRELVAMVELDGLVDRRPGELSGGEAQRLALARALASDPKLLLLDEPMGPLDARLRSALIERLGALHAELGLTTLYVTHDPSEARSVATGSLALEGGRLVA